jgi:hypothetical protein
MTISSRIDRWQRTSYQSYDGVVFEYRIWPFDDKNQCVSHLPIYQLSLAVATGVDIRFSWVLPYALHEGGDVQITPDLDVTLRSLSELPFLREVRCSDGWLWIELSPEASEYKENPDAIGLSLAEKYLAPLVAVRDALEKASTSPNGEDWLGRTTKRRSFRPRLTAEVVLVLILLLALASVISRNWNSRHQRQAGQVGGRTRLATAPVNATGVASPDVRIGNMYRRGSAGLPDPIEAIKWYSKAANQNDAEAQYNLGEMSELGEGGRADIEAAIKWYRRAALQGHSLAQHRLGYIYDSGKDVPRNAAEAIKWYTRAANQGESLDEFVLGGIYAAGTDVPKDLVKAIYWYEMAQAAGFDAAGIQLKSLRAQLPR